MFGQAAGERVARDIQCMAQVIDAGQQQGREHLAVRYDAADRHATKVDAVIALFTADQPRTVAFTACAVAADGNLERSVYGFRTRIGKEAV